MKKTLLSFTILAGTFSFCFAQGFLAAPLARSFVGRVAAEEAATWGASRMAAEATTAWTISKTGSEALTLGERYAGKGLTYADRYNGHVDLTEFLGEGSSISRYEQMRTVTFNSKGELTYATSALETVFHDPVTLRRFSGTVVDNVDKLSRQIEILMKTLDVAINKETLLEAYVKLCILEDAFIAKQANQLSRFNVVRSLESESGNGFILLSRNNPGLESPYLFTYDRTAAKPDPAVIKKRITESLDAFENTTEFKEISTEYQVPKRAKTANKSEPIPVKTTITKIPEKTIYTVSDASVFFPKVQRFEFENPAQTFTLPKELTTPNAVLIGDDIINQRY